MMRRRALTAVFLLGATVLLASNLLQGAGPGGSQFDEVNRADIQEGLVGHWQFNETEGNTVYDDSGCGNHGTNYGADREEHISGGALNFNPTQGDRVEVPDDSTLRIDDVISVAFWAKRQRFAIDMVLNKGGDWHVGDANYGVALHNESQNYMFYFFFRDGWRGTPGVRDMGWHHYVVVARHGASNAQFYIDGNAQPAILSQGKATMDLYPSGLNLHIGAQIDNGPYYSHYNNNIMDDIRIYHRELTCADVQEIYQQTFKKVDFNRDKKVDLRDMAIFAGQWLQTASLLAADVCPACGDDVVNLRDLHVLISNWLMNY